MSTQRKLGLLACLYLSQGLPYGFFTQALPALLRLQDVSLEHIGLASLLFLPWALKFAWAPLVDRYGRRRTWILPLQATSVLVLLALGALDAATMMPWVLGGVLLVNLLAASQDIATDGLAVDLLAPAERGLGNGVQVAGYRLGMIVGGGALLIALDALGWQRSFWAMAGLLALATLPIALYREAAPGPREAAPDMRTAVIEWFRRPGMLRWTAILVLYKAFDAIAKPMVKPMMIDQLYDLGDIGWIVGGAGSVAGLAGALAGGYGVVRLGRRRALLVFGVLQTLAVAVYVVPALRWGGEPGLYAAVFFDELFGGMATAALFTMMMDVCRPDSAATDYTIQASVVVIAVGATSAFSGYLAGALGYAGHFAIAAVLTLAGLGLVARLLPSNEQVRS